MTRTMGRMRVCVTLLALNLVFIWGNSLMPGDVSGAFSRWVKSLLDAIFHRDGADSETGHGLLRKLAHFTEFCCLGIWLTWLFSMLGRKPWLSLPCGFLAACVDETIQRFVPNRGPGFRDVCIDTAGVILGILLILAGHTIYTKRKNRKTKKFLEETNR